jgi:hypothetical protein
MFTLERRNSSLTGENEALKRMILNSDINKQVETYKK